MTAILISTIHTLSTLIFVLVFAEVVLSWLLPPDHQARLVVGRFTEPLLGPIRRLLPVMGPFDFSPLILILLVQLVENLLVNMLGGL